MSYEPPWLAAARKDVGLREIPGAPTAPKIAGWLKTLRAWWTDDETPWCGVAVAAWMNECAIPYPKHFYRARAWADWGVPLAMPSYGAVAVFERKGGGHVGLVVGESPDGRLMVLGGNQGNSVNIAAFDRSRVIAFRWPTEQLPMLNASRLPIILASGASSTNEA